MTEPFSILLIGSGGREHALAWAIAKSPLCARLFIAPGNPGTAQHGENRPDLPVSDHAAVVAFCKAEGVGLVVVGPEAPLVAGLVDDLQPASPPSARRRPPRSSKARRASPRICAPSAGFRRPPSPASPNSRRRWPT